MYKAVGVRDSVIMWQVAGLARYRRIWLEDGILKADGTCESLWPFKEPGLPTEFAKVNDAKTAKRFEERYAPLGYDFLVENPEERKRGDPLAWVLLHARFVRIALDLMYDVAGRYGGDALEQFRYCGIREIPIAEAQKLTSGQKKLGILDYPCGAYTCTTLVPVPRSTSEALWAAPSLISLLVNANTKNVRSELVVHHKARLGSVLFFRALIEAIWSMLGNLALAAGDDSVHWEKCVHCHTPFLATDDRQQFCPPPEGGFVGRRQSLCGLKHRQRIYRKKRKGGKK
jgi:hypothetical protein